MKSPLTVVQRFQAGSSHYSSYRSGVSLHSHTMHSKERLNRLPTYIDKFPIGGYILERELGRLHLYHGWNFDFTRYYWTPPLSPREAYELESKPILQSLGLQPLVSLSDHDNVEAGLQLRMLDETKDVPISVEWTAPFEKSIFHLGVHNLPVARAREWMSALEEYARKPSVARLGELLAGLNACPSVLIVLNHPYWSAENIAADAHAHSLKLFLEKYPSLVHALELNGMRSRRENRAVLALGDATGIPVISGGDRHGCEPNAALNLTRASTFEALVWEMREQRRSEILLMPQYFEALPLRLLDNTCHALADAPGEFGRRHWMTRVFVEANGETMPLSQYAGTRFQRVVERFRWFLGLAASSKLRPALRLAFLGNEEGGL
ncbi:MAG TPA: hypothetical protein VL128_17655 [Candidatus Eisenbacteria bacterium]|nr:hypothetical protein [Candidatus Eisenbacteria bacterium]